MYSIILKFWCVWVGVGIILVLLTQLLNSLNDMVLPGEKAFSLCVSESFPADSLPGKWHPNLGLPDQALTGCSLLAPREIDCVIPHRGMSCCCLNSREGWLGPLCWCLVPWAVLCWEWPMERSHEGVLGGRSKAAVPSGVCWVPLGSCARKQLCSHALHNTTVLAPLVR